MLLSTRVKNICFYVIAGVLTSLVGSQAFESNLVIGSNPNFPWFWKSSLSAVFCLSIGGLYRQYEDVLNKKLHLDNWSNVVFMSVAYACYCLFHFSAYNGGLDSAPLTVRSALLSIIGILALISLCRKLPSCKFIDYWGSIPWGFIFYVVQSPIQ